jgi:NAD(P)-dependent dehydrogenase (short-subunit alcohol dehydrogenase family)
VQRMTLEGRVAVITGGGRGIGRALAQSLVAAGAAVVIAGRSAAALEAACAAIGPQAHPVACDVTDPQAVARLFEAARQVCGPADILINNAGVTASARVVDTDDATWEQIMAVNVTGAFRCCRAAIPDMQARGWGRIINVASIAALSGMAFSAAYSASKHALLGLTRSLALELRRSGITANALCPGWTETDMLHEAIENLVAKTGRTPEQARASLLALSGQTRAVTADEVAAAAMRLLGPEGGAISGEAITLL